MSIPCLNYDQELIKTIRCINDNSSGKNKITIGIAIIGNEDFMSFIKEQLIKYKYTNVKLSFFKFENNIGVGKGRHLAYSMYNNEDYLLQIDSHTFLLKNWDKKLINIHRRAKIVTKNKLVVLSGLPPAYGYFNEQAEKSFWHHKQCKYPQYLNNDYLINSSNNKDFYKIKNKMYKEMIPKFIDNNFNKLRKESKTKKRLSNIYPLHKISAAFMFGAKNFAYNIGLESNSIFWEEEILQSINLINNGFSICFYNGKIPLCHYYSNEMKKDKFGIRSFATDIIDEKELYKKMAEKWSAFMNNKENQLKIKKYEKYADVDLNIGANNKNFIPKKFNK